MLRSLAAPEGYRLEASDGTLGTCEDFLFDDHQWTVRYLVADTRRWLPGRKVLVSPAQFGEPDWQTRRIPVRLSRQQIRESPSLDSDAPVSRRYERAFNSFYMLPHYWLGAGLWGDYPLPMDMHTPLVAPRPQTHPPETPPPQMHFEAPVRTTEAVVADTERAVDEAEATHLRSMREVLGYRVRCTREDAAVGRLIDLIVDDSAWAIRVLAVDTSRLPFSRKFLVPVDWVEAIDWVERELVLGIASVQIADAPDFDPHAPVNQQQETLLYDYYGRPRGRL